jgi:hypothetical protein
MAKTQNEILVEARSVLSQVPFRTKFERENFLYGAFTGPRLLVALCKEIEVLNGMHNASVLDYEKDSILEEMNILAARAEEIRQELGTNVKQAIEDAEAGYWVEEMARRSAVEAICQAVTTETMDQMLKLPSELYEETITKCQTFLNVINKTTRLAERKANVSNIKTDEE